MSNWRRTFRTGAATAGAALATAFLLPAGAVAAAASPGPMAVARGALAGLHVGAPNHLATGGVTGVLGTTTLGSHNWSGWADNNSTGDTYTAVSGKWTEPSITCIRSTDLEAAAFWTGIDGLSNSTVEQAGTIAICQNGVKSYYSWWEMYPTNAVQFGPAVNPGDKITSSVTFSGGKYHLKVTDATTPSGSLSTTQACGTSPCVRGSAEWVAERPGVSSGGYAVLPKFGSWKVSAASATSGGTKRVISAYPDDQIFMVNSSSSLLASPSALNVAGNSFKVAWKASA